ncbi:hypothetical protein GDO78_021004 [Eleutherodactylus coqui]|uniref:Uncharacterized protein n=1 Tax=Eleutherodactylus coqui TaxID=57060 RepID=A0A8J6EHA1_ELECQ|nr:hypothetical protein GDO78_021004 [Eleutherodactylus coqui]
MCAFSSYSCASPVCRGGLLLLCCFWTENFLSISKGRHYELMIFDEKLCPNFIRACQSSTLIHLLPGSEKMTHLESHRFH